MTIYKFNKYSNKYPKLFEREKQRLLKIFPKKIKIEHIGSTSVPNLGGKRVIDIIIGVKRNKINFYRKILIKNKYRYVETIEGRHFFTKNRGRHVNNRYHIHLTEYNKKIWKQALKFKKELKKNKSLRENYIKLKKKAVKICKGDGKIYRHHKNKFIRKALK